MVEATSLRSLDFIAALVDIDAVPSAAAGWRRLEAEIYEVSKPLLGQQKRLAEPVATGDILELSRKLSYSTAAPSGWHFSHNREIPVPFRPPAPQEDSYSEVAPAQPPPPAPAADSYGAEQQVESWHPIDWSSIDR